MATPVFHLDLTLESPAQNLALDEALLDWAELLPGRQVLRTWQPSQCFVVVGYGNEVAREVHTQACQQSRIPILRRCTGGGTVLLGPGCLNYTLVLDIDFHPDLRSVATANRFIMERNRAALQSLLDQTVTIQGHTDLAIGQRKCSGNAQRRARRCLLFHGTFLLQTGLERMDQLLPLPSRRPDYRGDRSHEDFLTQLGLPAHRVAAALRQAWQAQRPLDPWPQEAALQLSASKYSSLEWIYKR